MFSSLTVLLVCYGCNMFTETLANFMIQCGLYSVMMSEAGTDPKEMCIETMLLHTRANTNAINVLYL